MVTGNVGVLCSAMVRLSACRLNSHTGVRPSGRFRRAQDLRPPKSLHSRFMMMPWLDRLPAWDEAGEAPAMVTAVRFEMLGRDTPPAMPSIRMGRPLTSVLSLLGR